MLASEPNEMRVLATRLEQLAQESDSLRLHSHSLVNSVLNLWSGGEPAFIRRLFVRHLNWSFSGSFSIWIQGLFIYLFLLLMKVL